MGTAAQMPALEAEPRLAEGLQRPLSATAAIERRSGRDANAPPESASLPVAAEASERPAASHVPKKHSKDWSWSALEEAAFAAGARLREEALPPTEQAGDESRSGLDANAPHESASLSAAAEASEQHFNDWSWSARQEKAYAWKVQRLLGASLMCASECRCNGVSCLDCCARRCSSQVCFCAGAPRWWYNKCVDCAVQQKSQSLCFCAGAPRWWHQKCVDCAVKQKSQSVCFCAGAPRFWRNKCVDCAVKQKSQSLCFCAGAPRFWHNTCVDCAVKQKSQTLCFCAGAPRFKSCCARCRRLAKFFGDAVSLEQLRETLGRSLERLHAQDQLILEALADYEDAIGGMMSTLCCFPKLVCLKEYVQLLAPECIEIAQCKVQKCRSCLESLAAAYERPDVSYQSQLQSFDDISVYLCNYSQWCTGNWPRQVLDQIASGITYALMRTLPRRRTDFLE